MEWVVPQAVEPVGKGRFGEFLVFFIYIFQKMRSVVCARRSRVVRMQL